MGLDCGGSCMKYLLFFFNFIFFICGAAILGIGIWAYVDPTITSYVELTAGANFKAACILLIVVGAIIFVVGFLGCCGACKESTCMLSMFAGLMVLILLLQIVAAILAAVYQSELEKTLKDELAEQAKNVTGENSDPLTRAFNLMQTQFKCCGSNNPSDYQGGSLIDNKNVPQGCCIHRNDSGASDEPEATNWQTCSDGWENKDEVYQIGCYDNFVKWVKDHAVILLGIGFGLAAVEILGIVLACCVKSKIKENY